MCASVGSCESVGWIVKRCEVTSLVAEGAALEVLMADMAPFILNRYSVG